MQLQTANRQNQAHQLPQSHHQDSLECSQTLSMPLADHPENRLVKTCGCRCTCLTEDHQEDALEKRRQKRKESKRRQKERQKQLREKALLSLQKIIRNIYALHSHFKEYESEIKNCFLIETSRDRLCEFINMVIREQIDLIRREIVQAISTVDQLPEGEEHRAIGSVFFPIQKIVQASPEIERLINLFVASYSEEDEEETPMQRNLDRTTLKFLVKTDLYSTASFNRLCSHIFQAPPELYLKERKLITLMMSSFEHSHELTHYAQPHYDSEDDTEECLEYEYEEEEWEEEGSTIESPKNSANERTRRRRKERRRKLREEFESSVEAIVKRTQQIVVVEQERNVCNVSEQWIEKMRLRRRTYAATASSH